MNFRILLISILLLFGCSEETERSAFLMPDVAWSFREGSYENQKLFVEAVYQYNDELDSPIPEFYFQTSLPVSRVSVSYNYWVEKDDDWAEFREFVTIDSESGMLSLGELLFKLHEAVRPNLADQDRSYFEGLEFTSSGSTDQEYSFKLVLGS